ncbi:MAG: LytTR family DNA-binding domain-containing protein [Bacteroidales bacterium]
MDKMKCIAVDDEPLALNLLVDYIGRTPFLELTAKCSSAIEALNAVRTNHVDLAFMDIQMPQINGLELSKMLDGTMVIFTTAFDKYAIEGFRVNAVDYLLKPFSYAEFLTAANKACKWFELNAKANEAHARPANSAQQPALKSIVVKSDYRQKVVDLDAITFVEGQRDYILIHTDNGEAPVQTLMSLKSIEDILPDSNFVRVHRSFIVNVNKIKFIERNRIVFGKDYIPISDQYKDAFEKKFKYFTK